MTLIATDYEDDKNDPALIELSKKCYNRMFLRFKANDALVKAGIVKTYIKDMSQREYDEFMVKLDRLTDAVLLVNKQPNGY